MKSISRSLIALLIGGWVMALASQASAQPDIQPPPPNPAKISDHRAAALEKCTSGITFSSDRYVACMLRESEAP
jgi:hypothetical protein